MNKILIVEDEEALGMTLKEELADNGFVTELVPEGGQAVFDAVGRFHPNLILLDVMLPKMNGLEILKHLKSDAEMSRIPVIMLTSMEQDETIKEASSLGAADYFVKSRHPLKEVIEKVKLYITSH